MANDILIKVSFLLNIIPLILSADEQIMCSKNDALLEITSDAILTVFVDANYGQYCNISSSKGLQQISTILYVMQTLNKYDYVPGVKLGLRIFDTCQDGITLFRQVLRVAVEQSCALNYEMGVMVPSRLSFMMDYLRDHGNLPISVYGERDFTMPAIDILAHYLSTRYETVDLVHANADSVLDHFLEVTKDAGVCVKRSDRRVNGDRYANVTETTIVAIGERNDVLRWLGENEESGGSRKTWLLLPLDNSDIDDLVPSGSYVIKPEIPRFDLGGFSSADEFLENSGNSVPGNRSPYLLDIGKAVIEIAEAFRNVRERSCPIDNTEDCIVAQFGTELQRQIRDLDVYEILRIQPRSHSVRYVVATKTQHELVDVASYEIEVAKLRVLPVRMTSRIPGLCLEHLAINCENCTNFQTRSSAQDVTKANVDKNVLKNSIYVPIFLIAIACGTVACCVMVIFIVYRFATEDMLDGNPALTIVLVLANLFTLLTAVPFCMTDDYFGAENLNARKILLTTLAFGLTFSIMLSRALFLALSTGSVFVHINGYLQSLMLTFFMCGVQAAISIMYFVLNTTNSAVAARSLIFIALLGYDIFLLIALFITCCFIIRIQRNYHEGKCFFGTAIGLLITWAMWLICFMLMRLENRDAIVSFGIIITTYLIIFGVLIPRIYYMVTHLSEGKDLGRRFDLINLPTDSIVNTIIGQSRSHDYVHPIRESQVLRVPSPCPNYYGNSSLRLKHLERCKSPNHHETIYNYEFAEMKEIDTTAPQVYTENMKSSNNVIYAQPRVYKSQRIIFGERSNAEASCNRNDSSPISRPHVEMYPMRYTNPTNMARERKIDEEEEEEDEENEEDESDSRITRF
ncbi:hypothetical protein P5V15_005742 [Pogonomyrmex californicus]